MNKRIITAIFTLIGAALGLALSLTLDKMVFETASSLPKFVEVGIFFTLPALFASIGGLAAAFICPIVPFSTDTVFRNCIITVLILSIFGVFLLSSGSQKLYELSTRHSHNSVVIVLDQSGSMRGERNENTIKAAQKLVDSLGSDDKVGLVFFGTTAVTKSKMRQATDENKKLIKREIRKLEATDAQNILQLALDESVKLLSDEESENKGIFFVSDFDGANDLSLMGELNKKAFIKKEIPLHVLVINSVQNFEMQRFSKQSGGKCIYTDDPDDIEELYMSMFDEFYQEDLQLNHLRGEGQTNWLRILISALYFILLGTLMSAVYTILYNNRHTVFVWNFIMGFLAAIIIELNHVYIREPILMLAAIFIIYPTLYIGSLPKPEEIRTNTKISGTTINGPDIFDEGHIIK